MHRIPAAGLTASLIGEQGYSSGPGIQEYTGLYQRTPHTKQSDNTANAQFFP
jgi:hypothetical protein